MIDQGQEKPIFLREVCYQRKRFYHKAIISKTINISSMIDKYNRPENRTPNQSLIYSQFAIVMDVALHVEK